MAEYTENFNLKKPGQNDYYNIEDFNDNTDIIDAELKKLNDAIKNLDVDNVIAAINEIFQALAAHKADNVAHGTATQAEAQAGTSNTKYMTPLRTKEAIQALATNGAIKSVQRGRAELRDGDTVINITISPVNTSKTMVNLVSSHSGSSHTEVALELTSATNLRATKHGIDYTLGVAWEVIEFY